MSVSDEIQIVQRAQAGDRDAFAALHDRYWQAIYTYVYYRVDDQDAADDLTAEVFVRMVEKIDKYRPRGKPFVAWLYTIARNLLTDYYRRRGRDAETLPLEDLPLASPSNPSDAAENHLAAECLGRAIRQLTEDQRLVVIGKFIEGRSNAEIARILEKTEGSVKSLQHRALAALRRVIEREGCYEA